MVAQDIKEIIAIIPDDMPLYASVTQLTNDQAVKNQLYVKRAACALFDPAFGWKYAKALAQHKGRISSRAIRTSIPDAVNYLTHGSRNHDLHDALMFREDCMRMKRALLEALLIMPSVPLEQISKLTCMSVKAITVYSQLWFDVRDRLDDQCYVASIVWPRTRQVSLQPDYLATATPEELLLRAAHEGDLNVVLALFGAVSAGKQIPEEELRRLLQVRILEEAWFVVQAGGIHQDLPILRQAMKLITASNKAEARAQAAPRVVGAWTASTRVPAPSVSVLSQATAMADAPANKLRASNWIYLAKSSGSSVPPASSASSGITFRLCQPLREVSRPVELGRNRSCAFPSESRERMAAVTCL